jgi:hypothetical protein
VRHVPAADLEVGDGHGVVFTSTPQLGFIDVARPSGDLGAQLHQADLFGLV